MRVIILIILIMIKMVRIGIEGPDFTIRANRQQIGASDGYVTRERVVLKIWNI